MLPWLLLFQGVGSAFSARGPVFKKNKAVDGTGGAILVAGSNGTVEITRSPMFSKNEATDSGGAIGITGIDHSINIVGPSFRDNSAQRAGGAMFAEVRFEIVPYVFVNIFYPIIVL